MKCLHCNNIVTFVDVLRYNCWTKKI